MLCPNCNTYFEDNFAFCPKCGSKLELTKKDWDKLRNENGKFAYVSKGEQVEFDTMQDLAKGFAEEVMTIALFHKIEECMDEKDYDEAFHILYPVLTENPEDMELWDLLYKIIRCTMDDMKIRDATVYITEGIRIDNKDDHLWNELGVCFCFQKNYQTAMDCYDRAIKFNGNNDEYWSNKGYLLLLNGTKFFKYHNLDECINCFNEALICFDQAMKIDGGNKYLDIFKQVIIDINSLNKDNTLPYMFGFSE